MVNLSKTLIFEAELQERIRKFIDFHKLLVHDQTIIVGCSGGPDSLFLVHALYALRSEYNLTIVIAHLDHEWRPESARDLAFCADVAAALGLPFVAAKAAEIALPKESKGSREDLGRLQRRAFFESVAQQHDNAIIALGHHADDQQETFFIRLLRGAGVTGLAGIRVRDGRYIHPLLCCTKEEIVTTLEKNKIPFLVDVTNTSDQFLRNRIRLNVIPALRQCDARFDESINRTMSHLRDADDFLIAHTQELFTTCSVLENNKRSIDITKLFALHPFMQRRVLLHWFITEQVHFVPSDAFFEEIIRFLHNKKSMEHTLYQTWSIIKKGSFLFITRK